MRKRLSALLLLTAFATAGCRDAAKPTTPEKTPAPATAPAAQTVPAPAAPAETAWRELFDGKSLDGWRESGFGGSGETLVEDGVIRITMGERLSGITSTATDLPKTNYEIELEARRVEGNDFFVGLTFPVADSHASLILGGWGGAVCGISSIDDEDASENATRKLMRFKRGQWYKVRVRVEPTRLQAWVDDAPLVDVDTTGKKVGLRSEITLGTPLGLSTFATTGEVKSVRVRPLVN